MIGRVGEKETGTPLLKSISKSWSLGVQDEFVTPIALVLNYICFANQLSATRLHFLFREFTICFANLLSFSRIHYIFREPTICLANPLSVLQIRYLFREFTTFFANPL